MPYETARLLAYQSYQHWLSSELFTFGWYVSVGVVLLTYAIWFKLVDKRRIKDLLLLGSLCAVAFATVDTTLVGYLGLWTFNIKLFPFNPPLFIVGFTIGPIMYMLVLQYTSSWKSYLIWNGIGCAIIVFGLLPAYSFLGIFQLVKWNWIYHYLLFFIVGTVAKGLLNWFTYIEKSQVTLYSRDTDSALQPAACKLLQGKEENKEKD